MPRFMHNGIALAYEDRGSGKPAIIFIHGWTCDRSFFAPQAEYFERRHRVVSVDLRGHGHSDNPQGKHSVELYAEDVAHLISHLGLAKVVAVGHSLGALVALQLAAAHADDIAGVVMVESAPFAPPAELRALFEQVASNIEAGDDSLRQQLIAGLFLPSSNRELVERVLHVMMSAPRDVAAGGVRAILDFNAPSAAARCTVPSLHISAARPLNPVNLMTEWLPGLVQGQTVGAGHFNQLEAPEQVNGMLEGFLRHYVGETEGALSEKA